MAARARLALGRAWLRGSRTRPWRIWRALCAAQTAAGSFGPALAARRFRGSNARACERRLVLSRHFFFAPHSRSSLCAAASPLTPMLLMVSEPSLIDPPVRTQDPSEALLHALHGMRSMSPGQLPIVQTRSSARTDVIVAMNATAVRNPNLDMFHLASAPDRDTF